jgi:hypothetical protein
MGRGEERTARIFAYKLAFKSLKNYFTDWPRVFEIEYMFKNAFNLITNALIRYIHRSRDSSIGVALAYGLDGRGSTRLFSSP